MASSSSMLTFPVGFDFSDAVKAEEIKKALDRAEKIVKGKPIAVTADFDRTGLDKMESYYDESIKRIQNRITKLNKAWAKLSPSDIYTSGKTELSDTAVNIGSKAKPEMLSPKQIYAEWEQLVMLLQLAGKTLSQIHQERMKNMNDEERALQRQKQQIEQETAARTRQAEIIGRLNDKILSSQIAREDTSRQVTAITKATDAYTAQDRAVARLTADLNNQIATKLKLESTGKAYNKDGTQTKAYTDVLQRELELTKQLATAEAELTARYERQFQLLKQIGLSANQTSLGALASNPSANAAIDAQIQKYNQLKAQINAVTADFERLKALQLQSGGTGYEDIINQKLKLRAQLEKELAKVTQTADQAQAKMLREQEALTAKITARKQAQIAKQAQEQRQIQQRLTALKQERAALVLKENTLDNIQKKLAATQALLQKTDFVGDPARFKRVQEEIERLSQKLQSLSGKQDKAKKAAESHTKGLEYQKGVLDRLIQRMAVYASFGALVGFAQKVREVTAEFERQRVALGAIINDQVKGNALFSEIKQFALKSPIKILDLTRYTKQVAAYRIETDKLFDTTKRLADVSVGLGVDMQRLVLAYGQVKAATYLRASELRQFTEAGIPMLELLAEKFTEVEGRMVSTADVMKRISKRGVEFKEVEQVFKDMTDAGGMFYNMQEKLGNTLYGLWAKLGDAASIMYDQIGNTESVNKGMKAIIQTMSSMMRNWKDVTRYVIEAGLAFGVYKLYTMAAAVAVKYYTASLKLAVAEQRAMYIETINHTKASKMFAAALQLMHVSMGKAAAATAVFNRVLHFMKAAIIQTGIGALIVALGYLIDKLLFAKSAADQLNESLADIDKESGIEQMKSVRNFESLANAAVKAADGSKKQRDALDELRRTYADIIPLEKLTIENLRQMNGNYEVLTSSIRKYIAEQMKQKKISTIIESTGRDIINAQKELEDWMSHYGMGDEQIGRFWRVFEKKARESNKSVQELVKDTADEIGSVPDAIANNYASFNKYTEAIRKQESEINKVSYAWTEGYEALGKYGSEFEKYINNANEKAILSVGDVKVDENDYLYKQQRLNLQIYEAIAPQLKKILKDAGVAWQEGWGYLIKEVDKSAPEMISAINWDLVEKYLNDNISKIPSDQYQNIQALHKIYDELAPSDKQTRIVRERFMEIVQSVTGGMDKMSQYGRFLKSNGQDVKDYVKFLDEQIDEINTQITELEDTANLGAKVSLFARNIFAAITGGEVLTAEELKEQLEVLKKARADFSNYNKDTGRGRQSDPRLQILQEIANKMAEINKEYDDLLKNESQTQALADAQRLFAATFEDMQKVADKYHFQLPKFDVPKTVADVQKWYKAIQDEINRLGIKNADKVLIELGFKADKLGIDEAQRKIEEQLKRLSEQVAQSKAAKEFFDNIFAQTKDYDMAMELTMSIYGDTGENYQQQIIDQIRAAFGAGTDWEIDVTPAINVETGAVNYNELEKLMETALKDEDLEKYREQMKKVIEDGRKFGAERAKQWMKDLAVAQTYAQKRVDLARYTAEQIAAIENDLSLSRRTKDEMQAGYLAREAKEAAKLEWEAFKDTPMYVQMFENLDNASQTMLKNMRDRLVALKSQWKNLSPKELKELQTNLNKINEQLAQRNPFKAITDGLKEASNYRKEYGSIKDVEEKLAKATQDEARAQQTLNQALDKQVKLRIELAMLQNDPTATKEQIDAKKKELDLQADIVRSAESHLNTTQQTTNELQKQADKWKDIVDGIENGINALDKYKGYFDQLASSAKELMETFGLNDIDMQYFDDMISGFNQLYNGAKNAATGVTQLMSGDIIGGAVNIVSGIGSAVAGISNLFSAGKVKKANKEIKKQQELIEALSYSYDRLEAAVDRTFGSDYIANYNQRLENLQAQQAAYMKQAEAERSKGKKADKDKIKEYEEAARDTADQIAEMRSEIAETLAGADVASAARDFASAWLDAYISFESTTQAIKEKFNDMIKNMIIESAMGQIVQAVLQPFFDEIKEAAESGGRLDAQEVVDLANKIPTYTDQVTNGLQIFANQLESLGYDLTQLGDTGEFTGIAREIASASEESITGLAAAINTQNYYISNVPLIYQEVMLIRQLLSGENPAAASRSPMLDTTDLQNEYLSHLPAIHTNTESIAERCERAATACEDIASNLRRVIKPRGIDGGYVVNIS